MATQYKKSAGQLRRDRRGRLVLVIFSVLLLLSFIVSMNTGYTRLSPLDTLRTLFGGGTENEQLILFQFRLPRILLSIFSGFGLALSGCIIPVGGGKDSIVTLTLLSGMKEESFCYVMNSRGATEHSAEIAGYPPERRLNIRRTLAPEMLALNKQGYLNGHTPFSALVAFSGVLMAELYGKAYVVLSNESSANESTVKGLSVNHQYSKSFQFEADFDRYVKGFIGSRVQYFSLLRPWSEFQIAAYFAGLTAFHPYFRSCNAGSKTDSWCGKCAKCLFVALILTPFLPDEAIYGIFGREILEDTALIPTLQELCGETDEKPFECVGSREEIGCAMAMGIRAREAAGKKLPALLAYFKTSPAYPAAAADDSRFFRYYQEENLLPPAFDRMMREETRKLRERYCGGEG